MSGDLKYGKPVSDLTKSLKNQINNVRQKNKSKTTDGLGLNKAEAMTMPNKKIIKKPRPPGIVNTSTKDRNDRLEGIVESLKTRRNFFKDLGGSN